MLASSLLITDVPRRVRVQLKRQAHLVAKCIDRAKDGEQHSRKTMRHRKSALKQFDKLGAEASMRIFVSDPCSS